MCFYSFLIHVYFSSLIPPWNMQAGMQSILIVLILYCPVFLLKCLNEMLFDVVDDVIEQRTLQRRT